MKRFLTFFFIVVAGLAGLVSVPRCYVLQPDCPERGSFQCPYMADSAQAAAGNPAGGCCAMAQETRQQRSQSSLPGGKAVQFKVEQYLQLSDLHIDPPTESVLSANFSAAFHAVHAFQPGFSCRLVSVHPPPLSRLLQKQSFLI